MGTTKTRHMRFVLLAAATIVGIKADCTALIVPTEGCISSCSVGSCTCTFALTLARYLSEPWLKVSEAVIDGGSLQNSGCTAGDAGKCADSYLDDESLFFKYIKVSGAIDIQGSVGKISYDKEHFGKWAICPGEAEISQKGSCFFSTVPVNSPGLPSTLDFYDAQSANKTVVGKAKFTCQKKKSVFKAMFDYMVDPILSVI